MSQAVPTRGHAGTNYHSPVPDCVARVFVCLSSIIVCQTVHITLTDQVQVTLQLTVNLSHVVKRISDRVTLLEGGSEVFLSTGP